MNRQQLAIDVWKHPLIQEILSQRLAESSIVNRLIVEEIMQEAEKNTLSNKLSKLLKNIANPTEESVKLAIQKFLGNIQNGRRCNLDGTFPNLAKDAGREKSSI